MSRFTNPFLLKSVAASTVLAFAALHAQAAPVSVSISSFSFAPGGGYGVDANEGAGTLLEVLFTSTLVSAQNFQLNALNETFTFNVGTIKLNEPNASGGINANETDGLDVAANFTFISPFGSDVQVTASGSASTGSVSDDAIDLTITWTPVSVGFGSGGLLGISLAQLSLTGKETLAPIQTATITLLQLPVVTQPLQVPEPGSMMLAGVALAGLGFVRRSRRS